MVKGIEVFGNFFERYKSSYVLIGGAACDLWLSEVGLTFRATKDLDIVLVMEALDREFLTRFNEFVREGKYENRQKSTGKRRYYRFFEPKAPSFPYMLELFSRRLDENVFPGDREIIPIPVGEDLSSLSAILMDENYHSLLMSERRTVDNLTVISPAGLMCLKMHAWLDLSKRKQTGESVDSNDVKKHKNDVFRLFFTLQEDATMEAPEAIRHDIASFLTAMKSEAWDVKNLGRGLGVVNPPAADTIIKNLAQFFGVQIEE